jgi:hypothetical protein
MNNKTCGGPVWNKDNWLFLIRFIEDRGGSWEILNNGSLTWDGAKISHLERLVIEAFLGLISCDFSPIRTTNEANHEA